MIVERKKIEKMRRYFGGPEMRPEYWRRDFDLRLLGDSIQSQCQVNTKVNVEEASRTLILTKRIPTKKVVSVRREMATERS